MGDPRLQILREVTLAMKNGQFEFDPVNFDSDDDVTLLAKALIDLGRSIEQRFQKLNTLVSVTEKINSGILLDEVLNHVYDSFRPIIPYERIGFALISDDGERVIANWARSDRTPLKLRKGYHARLEGSSLEQIIETGKPRILNDLKEYLAEHPDSGSTRKIVSEGMRSSLTCPLVAMNKPVGFLFFSSRERDTYRNLHIEVFLQIAGQLSQIVEKGRLYQQLMELTQKLELRNQFIRDAFGRYVSDEVVESLLSFPKNLNLGGEKRRLSIMMSDLRGFTTLTESLKPEAVVQILNTYLGVMTEVIVDHGGTINEFIGDAILVIFGAPLARKDHARRAVRCALAMQNAMAEVNAINREAGLPELEMGIAIDTGESIVGNIGSQKRAKYGVVGSHVNLTSRIESLTTGRQILISDSTRKSLRSGLKIGRSYQIEAKGFKQKIKIHELLGCEHPEPLYLNYPPDPEAVREGLQGHHSNGNRLDSNGEPPGKARIVSTTEK